MPNLSITIRIFFIAVGAQFERAHGAAARGLMHDGWVWGWGGARQPQAVQSRHMAHVRARGVRDTLPRDLVVRTPNEN